MNMTRRSFIGSCAAALAIGWDLMHAERVVPVIQTVNVMDVRDWITMELRKMLTDEAVVGIVGGDGYYFVPQQTQAWIPAVRRGA